MEITDKEERLRERRRLKQQRHRARDLDEQKDLERQLYVLQNFLAKYKAHADTALPWKQVAVALQDAVDDATAVNIQLRQQVEQLSRLAHSLASRTIDHGFISVPEPFTWQVVGLPTDPAALGGATEGPAVHCRMKSGTR